MSWSPNQYERFAGPRLQPAKDLLAAVPDMRCASVIDLGCGAGAAFGLLADRFPGARIVAVDRSRAMLDRASTVAAQRAAVGDLIQADIALWNPDSAPDLVFSNAALHWLPDHQTLLPQILSWLAPGGVLAIQMPNMWQEPIHVLMRETASDVRWAARALPACLDNPVLAQEAYERLLSPLTRRLRVWEGAYRHVLTGQNPVLEWIRGSSLKPVLDILEEDEQKALLADYADALRQAYPADRRRETVLTYRRLFIIAQKPTD